MLVTKQLKIIPNTCIPSLFVGIQYKIKWALLCFFKGNFKTLLTNLFEILETDGDCILQLELAPTFVALILVHQHLRFALACAATPSSLKKKNHPFLKSAHRAPITRQLCFALAFSVASLLWSSRFALAFLVALLPQASCFALASMLVLCARWRRCALLHHHHLKKPKIACAGNSTCTQSLQQFLSPTP